MLEENVFARNGLLPSWWANAIQRFLSVGSPGFSLALQDGTHIQVVAGPDIDATVLAIAGYWRWNEATIVRAHPGGAAGTYDIYAVAAANKIDNAPAPGTDNTNRSFGLRIVEAGKTPAIEAGVVDIFRKVGFCVWNGTAITALTQTVGIPSATAERLLRPGDLKFTVRQELDVGFLKCEGQAVSRTTYAALFAAIGISQGAGDGSTTFNVPDYRERVPVGKGGSLALGAKGGEATHVLSTAEMPSHTHDLGEWNFSRPGEHTGGRVLSQDNFIEYAKLDLGPTAATGGGTAHNNMQPYTVCNVWVKT